MNNMEHKLRLYSKTGVTTDWRCPRSRYLGYEYDGKGLSNNTTSLELHLGSILHDGLSAIADATQAGNPVDIDLITNTAAASMKMSLMDAIDGEVQDLEFACEQGALAEGILRGFHKYMWPILMSQYPIIKLVEVPMIYKHDGLGFMARPDLVLQDEAGQNWYLEYKSTSSKKDAWFQSWDTSIQVHSTIRAIEEHLGEPVTGVIIQGLYKGYESYGKQSSPFCYCYRRAGNPPFTEDQISYEYRSGFKRYPIWELPGGVKKWVESMPDEILAEQFPQTQPIFINHDLIEDFFRQRALREYEIASTLSVLGDDEVRDDVKQAMIDSVFPQRFDQCVPSFGKPCAFKKICHGPKDMNPLENGYKYRSEDHLAPFRELL